MKGRKTSSAYEIYGFIPKFENGKHAAICKSCNRVLQNTAAIRLQKHRNSCAVLRVRGDPVHFSNREIKRRTMAKVNTIKQKEDINLNVKAECINIGFEDGNSNDNVNDNMSYEDTSTMETRNSLYQEQDPIQSPITKHQQQRLESFETYHATINCTRNLAPDIDDKIQESDDEHLVNIEEELDVIQNLMPRSKVSKQLQEEFVKVEMEYYHCRAAYFSKLSENCKIKRTLMLLESRKLQLEIEKLTNEN